MNNPHAGEIPIFPTSLQTVFFTEGSPAAIVVTRMKAGYRQRSVKMASAEAALAWAKKRQAGLVYVPAAADPGQN
jgi:hypothetical protein